MDLVQELILILVSTIFVNNFIFARFLGVCPFLGVSNRVDTSLGMGFAVIFVLTLSSAIAWMIQRYVLEPLDLVYLRTIVFILVIAAIVQLVEMVIQKTSPTLYKALGIYLPLITTNCAVLGVALLVVQKEYDFFPMLFFGAGAAIGFTLATVLLAGIREQLAVARIPKSFEGTPITLIVAGLMSLAFMGFSGLVRM